MASNFVNRLQERWESLSDQQRVDRLAQCRELESILHDCQRQQEEQQQLEQEQLEQQQQQRLQQLEQTQDSPWWRPFAKTDKSTESSAITTTSTCTNPPNAATPHINNNNNNSHQTLESTAIGIRMLRFFHWRELPLSVVERDTHCTRHRHALWACRAVALQCGQPLTQLRDCMDQQGAEQVLGVNMTNSSRRSQLASGYTQSEQGQQEAQRHVSISSKGNDSSSNIPCLEYQAVVGQCVAQNLHELQQRVELRRRKERENE